MGFFKKHARTILAAFGMLGLVVVGLALLAASFLCLVRISGALGFFSNPDGAVRKKVSNAKN